MKPEITALFMLALFMLALFMFGDNASVFDLKGNPRLGSNNWDTIGQSYCKFVVELLQRLVPFDFVQRADISWHFTKKCLYIKCRDHLRDSSINQSVRQEN